MLKKIIVITFMSICTTQGHEEVYKTWTSLDLVIANSTLTVKKSTYQLVLNYTENRFKTNIYPAADLTYPIDGEYALVKPSGFHDYSNRAKPLKSLILNQSTTVYINSSTSPITVYAASGSKIYDEGGNATVIDIDFKGSYYESYCEYLRDRPLYYMKKITLALVVFGISAAVGLPVATALLACRTAH